MHDKPEKFTKHCVDRLSSANTIKRKDISGSDRDLFLVNSSVQDVKYTVSLGDDISFPNCTCEDWRKTLMPCKHMLAVISLVDGFEWTSISLKYRNSPFLQLDSSVILETDETIKPPDDMLETEENVTQTVRLSEFRKKIFPKTSKASFCRDLLNQIKSMTFTVYDNDALDHLHELLSKAVKTLSYHAPKDDNLIIERPTVMRVVPKSSRRFAHLPKPKSKKTFLSGRVGVSTEKRKFAASIDVTQPKPKLKSPVIIEEYPPLNDLSQFDIPMETDMIWTTVEDNDLETNEEVEETEEKLSEEREREEEEGEEEEEEENEKEEEEDILITGVVEANNGEHPKRRKLCFSMEEKETILSKHMLTDESINIAQNLLLSQFPKISGFQDTVIGKTQQFEIIKSDEPFIQNLHAGSLHWVCVANMNKNKKNNEECQLFDSLSSGTVCSDVAKQIAAFMYCMSSEILVEVMPVQQQNNSVDCGLFAIAFATSLAFSQNPVHITFDKRQLRQHLVRCLEDEIMTPFPGKPKFSKCSKLRISNIEIYCNCRMPYYSDKEDNDDMVECSGCSEWYHVSCETVPPQVLSSRKKKWYCKGCIDLKQ